MPDLYPFINEGYRAMVFVDGENLAIRYGAAKRQQGSPDKAEVVHIPEVAVWAPILSPRNSSLSGTRVIRKHYYTSVPKGDPPKLQEVREQLKQQGFEAPNVFPKDKTKGSKRVDISLTTDMLLHAARKHYDIAVLVAGDEDYIPLVRAVKGEGARVHVWFLSNGLNPGPRLDDAAFAAATGGSGH